MFNGHFISNKSSHILYLYHTLILKKPQLWLWKKEIILGFSTKETENTYAALGHITYEKMYYNKSWILDFILYVYQNNLRGGGGEKNNENALLSQVTSIFFSYVSVFVILFFFFAEKIEIFYCICMLSNHRFCKMSTVGNVHNRHTAFLLENRTAPILTKKSYTYYYVLVLYCWQLYL